MVNEPITIAPAGTELQALVARIQQAATAAADVAMAAIVTQVHDLAAAADRELAFTRQCAADASAAPSCPDNIGEGFWDVGMTLYSAKDVARYAHEAQMWAAMYAHILARREQGLTPFCWEDDDLEREYAAVEEERGVS